MAAGETIDMSKRFGIKELKNDFSIDDFVTHNFWATEACGSFIVMAYNFMSLFRHALINSNKKKFLVLSYKSV